MGKISGSFNYLPMKTEMKKRCKGIPIIGDAILRNQFGVIGNNRKNSR